MKAFLIDRYGKNHGSIGEAPEPEPGTNNVLVKVHTGSVDLLDWKISKAVWTPSQKKSGCSPNPLRHRLQTSLTLIDIGAIANDPAFC